MDTNLSRDGTSEARRGAEAAELSNAMVRLYKELFGRGPTKAHSAYATPDIVLCTLEDSLTAAERKLVELGEHQALRDTRMLFQHASDDQFVQAVEAITGRVVRAFVSGIDTHNDVSSEVFYLEPLAPGDGRRPHEPRADTLVGQQGAAAASGQRLSPWTNRASDRIPRRRGPEPVVAANSWKPLPRQARASGFSRPGRQGRDSDTLLAVETLIRATPLVVGGGFMPPSIIAVILSCLGLSEQLGRVGRFAIGPGGPLVRGGGALMLAPLRPLGVELGVVGHSREPTSAFRLSAVG